MAYLPKVVAEGENVQGGSETENGTLTGTSDGNPQAVIVANQESPKGTVVPKEEIFRGQISKELTHAGIASIIWSFINAAIVSWQCANLSPDERLSLPPVVIYAVCGWLFVEGVLLLTTRTAAMLVVDGLTVIGIGLLNLVAGIGLLGAFQVVLGIGTIRRYRQYAAALRETVSSNASVGEGSPWEEGSQDYV